MADPRVLVAAAGRGQRAGLPYPKTLYPVDGIPILVRLLDTTRVIDDRPTVIVSPAGAAPIRDCLQRAGLQAHLVVQSEPRGMGDAVLRFEGSPAWDAAGHVLLVWGDLPFLQGETVVALARAHRERGNDFTFATRQVESAYTLVSRDADGRVCGVIETRERGMREPPPGEREIGLFVFRKDPVFATLREALPGRYGATTGEHGFLYVIGHLAARGHQVEALPIATALDTVSLNRLDDLTVAIDGGTP
jgi:bifunctional UDP-N-acetylglucosamine pyrophosphorylase/glucosamine-1-phosphate N-acetyltransferase